MLHTTALAYRPQAEAAAAKSKQYILKGVPYDWYHDEINEFLTAQSWTSIQALHKQRYNKDWRFSAIPPIADRDAFHYNIGTNKHISIFVAPTRPQQVSHSRAVRNTWSGFTHNHAQATKIADKDEVMATPRNNHEEAEQADAAENKRSRSRTRSPIKTTAIDPSSQNTQAEASNAQCTTHVPAQAPQSIASTDRRPIQRSGSHCPRMAAS